MARRDNGNGKGKSRSLAFAKGASVRRWGNKPIKSSQDLKAVMGDVLSDVCGDRIETRRASVIVSAGRALLQTVIAEYRHSEPIKGQPRNARTLALTA